MGTFTNTGSVATKGSGAKGPAAQRVEERRAKIKVFVKFKDSRHAQMPIDVVFHDEFDFPLENAQF